MALTLGLVVLALGVQPWTGSNPLAAQVQAAPTRTVEPLLGLVAVDTPIEAAERVKLHFPNQAPHLFHDHRYGGFLLF